MFGIGDAAPPFLILALDGAEWGASRLGLVGPRASLEAVE
jgi:hypothetical protein